MNGVTSCLGGLGLHVPNDSNAPDDWLKYPEILHGIIIYIITNICFKYYYYYYYYYYISFYYYYYYYYYKLVFLYYNIFNIIINFYYQYIFLNNKKKI